MLIGGNTNPNTGALGAYLMRQAKNEKVALWEIKGTLADNVKTALYEMAEIAKGTRCEEIFYHAHIDPRETEKLTKDQFLRSVEVLEKELGFVDHQRVIVEHVKEGRQHLHVVWSRIDVEKMKAVDVSFNYISHEKAKVQLEKEFGLDHVNGAHVHEDGRLLTAEEKRDRDKAPHRSQVERGKQDGHRNAYEIRDEIKALKEQADSPKAFRAALEDAGYFLTKGDKRDFVVVDRQGDTFNLARILKDRVVGLRDYLADVGPLPSVTEAQQIQAERRAVREAEARKLADVQRVGREVTGEKGQAAPEGLAQTAAEITRPKEPEKTGSAFAVKASDLQAMKRRKAPRRFSKQDHAGERSKERETRAIGKEEAAIKTRQQSAGKSPIKDLGKIEHTPKAAGAVADVATKALDVVEGVLDFFTGGAPVTPEQKEKRAEAKAAAHARLELRDKQTAIMDEIRETNRKAMEKAKQERAQNEKSKSRSGYERERER